MMMLSSLEKRVYINPFFIGADLTTRNLPLKVPSNIINQILLHIP